MKKRYLTGILALSIFLLGCSSNNFSSADTDAESIQTNDSETIAADIDETENDQTLSDAISATPYGITITNLTESSSFKANEDSSVCVLEAAASYPEITIEGNPSAAEKINSAIASELDTFWNFEQENAGYAEEEYLMSVDDPDYSFAPYTADFSYETKRCDDKLLSIVFKQYDYSGGAHGNTWSYGITFDTVTGERLYLETISDDYTVFYQMLANNLNHQVTLPAYKDFVFSDFTSDVEDSLLKDSASWYFDRSGMSFISNPYVLGSYAAGTFEFNIPYKELEGLKDTYTYDGAYICKLFPGISILHDINGDGTDDEICYSLEVDEDFSNPDIVLTINGRDFSKNLEELHLTYPWTGAYYLMDVDSEDTYIEIAISNENYDNQKETCTHFFRYDTTGQLVYQGNIPGIFNEDMQVRYNANGNLILCNRNGEPVNT